jgi:F-type H+/Na+-transporting ATPase subunit alpha
MIQDLKNSQTNKEYAEVTKVKYPIVEATGLPGARLNELVVFENGEYGQVHELDRNNLRIVLFSAHSVKIGAKIEKTNSTLQIPIHTNMFGQILTPFGIPITNELAPLKEITRLYIDNPPLSMNERVKINEPLLTGAAIVDILVPLGKGQRELILGDRKTGKTTFVLSAINNQLSNGSVVIYAAIGSKNTAIKMLEEFMNANELRKKNMIIVATSANDSPGIIYLTPYTAMTIAEYFKSQGRDVLLIFDDLLTHAKYFRELSLLAESFPGRDSYPGDIFYIHAKLLERAGNYSHPEKGTTAITCLPIAETQDADLTGYIISNLMSITDGHLFFDKNVFAKGTRPAINTPLSVTRVGRQTQDKIMKDINREVSGLFSVYDKVENLSHFGSEISESAKNTLALGNKIKIFFNQPEGLTYPREVYLILFSLLWLGAINTEQEIEQGREKLQIAYQDKSIQELITNILNTESFNGLLRGVGKYKESLIKLIF